MIKTLKEKLAKGNVHFTFTKKDGTLRRAYGTRNVNTISEAGATPSGNGAEKTGVVAYYDLEKQGWRSCLESAIVSVDDDIKSLRFYKEDSKWYADVPQHTKEENEMVCGADNILEIASEGTSEVTVRFALTEDVCPFYLAKLTMKGHDPNDGAFYTVTGPLAETYGGVFEAYLCNVVHTVLGEHPQEIFIIDYAA